MYFYRFWVFILALLIVILYLVTAYVPCVFPKTLCMPLESVNKIFGLISSLAGALLVLFALNKTTERHRGHNLMRLYIKELSNPINNIANVSFTTMSPSFNVSASSFDATHIKNATSLEELRDNLYDEIAEVRRVLRAEASKDKVDFNHVIDKQKLRMDDFNSILRKLSSDIRNLALGNTNQQLFGVFLVIFGSTLNAI
jgi:hypothetical protein